MMPAIRPVSRSARSRSARRRRWGALVSAFVALLMAAGPALGVEPASGVVPSIKLEPGPARIVSHGPRSRPVVALTFDDCRDREGVLALLRTLRGEGVPATFFPYGYAVRRAPDLWRQVAAAGFPIGNHTLSHPNLVTLAEGAVRYEFRAWRRIVEPIVGPAAIPYARPPYGSFNPATARAAAREGYPTLVLWDIDTRDWARPSAAVIADRAGRGTNGSIILMHCGPRQTVDALPAIIAGYRARGFGFVTIPELLEGTGPRLGEGRVAVPSADGQLVGPRGRPIAL